ncbi:type IX secretion system membrane protein PorP/SprF [Labilibaculum sp. DW002]|uniref:Type IX secretion system membrane protein PorP/SprF n=1 Tax=Paralabilibaculum antarcticum TaxID=2912572 RepID=A0ABT5VWE6_9BACT|nr:MULTISPECIES: type IX secretion system membrane protein PorP/SprF [unclassified Labilibaculum]MBI9058780.1 type IX secretion system membrane protein PorP/SprF [Labilibaculum sp.]MDE5419580.1 type IX secretion system membrane protein PorP/SprF [Labilibaculum sp. DW002]
MNRSSLQIIKCVALLVLIFPFGKVLKAQQDPMYTQYMHNPLTINPAYAGSTDMMSAMFLAREQWVGFDGAPKSRTLTLSAPITKYNVGAGFSYINDELGPVKQNSVYADFAYQLKLSERGTLAMGIKGGFDMIQIDLMNLTLNEQNDASFSSDFQEDFILNFGLGLYYYTPRYYLGVSIPRMLKNNYDDDGVNTTSLGYKERHYFITAGALFDINENVKFKPSILSKIVWNAPVSLDLSANFILNDKLWLGAAYRIDDAMSFLIHYQISEQLRVGYAFDLTESELRRYNNGTHEIMVAFDFQFNKKKVMTPRYF